MKTDPLEQSLRSLRFREPSPDARGAILAAAEAARPPEPERVPGLAELIRGLFWPVPRAWAALAAVWVVTLVVNHAARPADADSVQAGSFAADDSARPVPSIVRLALGEQSRLRDELLGTNRVLIPAVRPRKPAAPGPHSGLVHPLTRVC